MNEAEKWIAEVTDEVNRVAVASRADIPQPTLTRQVQAGKLTVENRVKIARAFGASVPAALIAHGLVTADNISEVTEIRTIRTTLAGATDLELLSELTRRADRRGFEEWPEGEQTEAIKSVKAEHNASVHDITAEEAAVLLKRHPQAANSRPGRDAEQEADPFPAAIVLDTDLTTNIIIEWQKYHGHRYERTAA